MLEEEVLNTIKEFNLIEKNDKVVVAVSGGPDSISLLNILVKLRKTYNLTLYVCHVNHLLRENANIDEEFVKNYCKENNIECFVKRADIHKISKEEKIGTEEAGRKVRYEFFDEILEKTISNKIAIAHNKNDNVETILLNMIRGAGTSGLIGIEAKNGKYIRPLIKSERKTIEKYCEENNLCPRIDETNKENIYNRNKIRNVIIPYIEKEFNPNFINTVDRLSSIVKEEEDFIKKIAKDEYKKVLIEKNNKYIELNLKEFNKLDLVIKKKIIFLCINDLMGSTKGIEKIHVEDLLKLFENNIGNKYLMPNKNLKVCMKNKQIYFEKQNLA